MFGEDFVQAKRRKLHVAPSHQTISSNNCTGVDKPTEFNSVDIKDTDNDQPPTFEQEFVDVAVRRGIGRDAMNEFLSLFRKHGIGNFPADLRSAIGTVRSCSIRPMCQGEYFHFGLLNQLNRVFFGVSLEEGSVISLIFNIDGLPLWRSSQRGFWPILSIAKVASTKTPVFMVGLFFGKGKPTSSHEFLREFLDELKELLSSNVKLNGVLVSLQITCFSCDAPARSFIKCVKSHNSDIGCERCTVEAVAVQTVKDTLVKRLVDTECSLRTDETFRRQSDSDYHHETSSISVLDVDMVRSFPLDYMHLVLLGAVKKCMLHWTNECNLRATKSALHRIGGLPLKQANTRISNCAGFMSIEFQRKPRVLSEIHYYKATEYRNFAVYLFPYVFRNTFPCEKVYKHFLLLFVALRFLLSSGLSEAKQNYCRELLKAFVSSCPKFYGLSFLVYNIHSLIHLVDDYEKFGNLDSVSCFPFESFMSTIKKCVRRGGGELAQVVRRMKEQDLLHKVVEDESQYVRLKMPHNEGPLGRFVVGTVREYAQAKVFGRLIRINSKDDTVSCSFGFCRVKNVVRENDHVFLLVLVYKFIENVFDYPCLSSEVGVVFCSDLGSKLESVHVRDVTKCLRIDVGDGDRCFVAKLLHDQ